MFKTLLSLLVLSALIVGPAFANEEAEKKDEAATTTSDDEKKTEEGAESEGH